MKKLFCVLSVFIVAQCNAQYGINYNQIIIIQNTIKIRFDSNDKYYIPNFFTLSSALQARQERYDFYRDLIENSWYDVTHFELINESNNIWVQREAKKIDDYMKANAQAISQVDLSVNGDYAIKIVNYITSIYTFDKYVRTEIKLLQAIEKEYSRLKRDYPDDFYKRERYKELGLVIEKIRNCEPSEIGSIGMLYGLY
jgi:hypothetical protein